MLTTQWAAYSSFQGCSYKQKPDEGGGAYPVESAMPAHTYVREDADTKHRQQHDRKMKDLCLADQI